MEYENHIKLLEYYNNRHRHPTTIVTRIAQRYYLLLENVKNEAIDLEEPKKRVCCKN